MITEEQKEKILEMMLKNISDKKISKLLDIPLDELRIAVTEIKEDIAKFTDLQKTKFFVGETFKLFSLMEKQLWEEFEEADPGSINRLQIMKLISQIRKDGIDLRERLGKFSEQPKQKIAWDKVQILPDQVKIAISQLVVGQLENLKQLPEPQPEEEKPLLDTTSPLMLSSIHSVQEDPD